MTRTRFILRLVSAVTVAAAISVGRADANIGLASKTFPPSAVARIRAAGLDPQSPSFEAAVRARLASQRAALAHIRPPAVKRLMPKTVAASTLTKLANETHPASGDAPQHPTGPRSNDRPSTLTFIAAYDIGILGGNLVNLVVLPGSNALFAASPSTLPAGPASYTINVPDCGQVVSPTDGALVHTNGFPSSLGGFVVPPPIPAGDSLYALSLNGSGPPLAIGAAPHAMTVNYEADGMALTVTTLTVKSAEKDAQAFDVTVDQTGTVTSDGGIDLTPDNMVAGQPGVTRFNETSTPMTGTDIVGLDVALGPGYTASAKIVSASSVADPPGNSDPDNQFRGATIAAQPANGRLQTSVDWHIGPYDSLQYVLEWTLTGPPGQRPALSMPLGGPCDS
jgi:hypothetical protein